MAHAPNHPLPNDAPVGPIDEVATRESVGLFAPTRTEQRTARIMGAWFLGTFVFSIPAFFFFEPILTGSADGSAEATRVGVGAVLEVLLAICGIATAVVIFPIVKRVRESVALGYVAARTVESVLILVGVLSLVTLVALAQGNDGTASANGALGEASRTLVALHEQTRLLGPQLCAGLGNGILLGYLMWRSRLVPRPLALVGLIGGPLALLAGVGVLVGVWTRSSGVPVALTAPEALWELSLSLWLLVRGFRTSPILSGAAMPNTSDPA